jgi:hypothetical protein
LNFNSLLRGEQRQTLPFSITPRQHGADETGRAANRFLSMETPNSKAEQLQSLALQLRMSASQTEDQDYIGLFLCAAMALEARAIHGSAYPRH